MGYEDRKYHHKYSYKVFEMENGETRNVSFTFLWTAQGIEYVKDELLNMNPPATHMAFNVGLQGPLTGNGLIVDGWS